MTISISGESVEFNRVRLKQWLELEELKQALRMAAERGETIGVSESICSYLSAASGADKETFESAPWYEVSRAFSEVDELNKPSMPFPLLTVEKIKEDKKVEWDYVGRSWYLWLHLL